MREGVYDVKLGKCIDRELGSAFLVSFWSYLLKELFFVVPGVCMN